MSLGPLKKWWTESEEFYFWWGYLGSPETFAPPPQPNPRDVLDLNSVLSPSQQHFNSGPQRSWMCDALPTFTSEKHHIPAQGACGAGSQGDIFTSDEGGPLVGGLTWQPAPVIGRALCTV